MDSGHAAKVVGNGILIQPFSPRVYQISLLRHVVSLDIGYFLFHPRPMDVGDILIAAIIIETFISSHNFTFSSHDTKLSYGSQGPHFKGGDRRSPAQQQRTAGSCIGSSRRREEEEDGCMEVL